MKIMNLAKKIACIVVSLSLVIPAVNIQASAKSSYDPEKALEYAKENWNINKNAKCAEFVSNCLKAGGCTVWSTGATTLQSRLRESGYGTWHKLIIEENGMIFASKNKDIASPGDPIFFYCPNEKDKKYFVHVVLYSGQNSRGYMTCYAHNSAKNDEIFAAKHCGYCDADTITAAYVYHMDGNGTTEKTEFFSCNVKIVCEKGKKVNLYDSPGDVKLKDYFSKGQTVYSTYGAKLSNGDVWYQISAQISGSQRVEKLWLRYDKSNVKITDLDVLSESPSPTKLPSPTNSPKPTAKPSPTYIPEISMEVDQETVSLRLPDESSKTVTLKVEGANGSNYNIVRTSSNPAVATGEMETSSGGTVKERIIGHSAGSAKITYALVNKSNKQTIKELSIMVYVEEISI